MKITTKILASSLFALTLGFASSPSVAKTTAIKFKSGASGATYSGKIKGYNTDSYTFYAKKGQILTPTVTGNVVAYLNHNSLSRGIDLTEYSSDLENGNYILPATGTYTIKVGQMRAMARQGKTPNYTLQLTIR